MTRPLVLSAVVVLGLGSAGTAIAQRSDNPQFMLGIGADHALAEIDSRPGSPQPYLSAELASAVLIQRIDLRVRAGADISPYGAWVGAGISVEADVPITPLFIEASGMPGLWADFDHPYRTGLFSDGLGHPVEFRTQLGVGWHLGETSGVLLSISHKSNANIPGHLSNPGIESIQLRYTQSF